MWLSSNDKGEIQCQHLVSWTMDVSQDMLNPGSRKTCRVPWALTHSTNSTEYLIVLLTAQRVNQAPPLKELQDWKGNTQTHHWMCTMMSGIEFVLCGRRKQVRHTQGQEWGPRSCGLQARGTLTQKKHSCGSQEEPQQRGRPGGGPKQGAGVQEKAPG